MQPKSLFPEVKSRRWWVFIGPAQIEGVWRRFLPKNMQHVIAMTTLAPDIPIVINPTARALEFALPLCTTAEAVKRFAGQSAKTLVVEIETPDYNLPKHFWMNTCVTTAAHAMGFDTWAITPRQLYKALMRRGAREVNI